MSKDKEVSHHSNMSQPEGHTWFVTGTGCSDGSAAVHCSLDAPAAVHCSLDAPAAPWRHLATGTIRVYMYRSLAASLRPDTE